MSLTVYTSRVYYTGADRYDITRKSGDAAFAPSWSILSSVLAARRSSLPGVEDQAWAEYVPAYLAEMRASYVEHRQRWTDLSRHGAVTLVCYCKHETHCHRYLLAECLVKQYGTVYMGER